jgi:hypothetical protein
MIPDDIDPAHNPARNGFHRTKDDVWLLLLVTNMDGNDARWNSSYNPNRNMALGIFRIVLLSISLSLLRIVDVSTI